MKTLSLKCVCAAIGNSLSMFVYRIQLELWRLVEGVMG